MIEKERTTNDRNGAVRDVVSELLSATSIDVTKLPVGDVQQLVDELQMLSENVPELFAYVDTGQRYRFVNKQFEKTFGLSKNEIIGKRVDQLIGLEDYQSIRHHIENALSGESTTFGTRIDTANGQRWLRVRYAPNRQDDKIVGFFALIADVTERMSIELELEREKSQFESVVRGFPDALMLASLDRKITFCNPGVSRVFGYEPDELEGKSTSILYADPDEFVQQGEIRFHGSADEHFEVSEIEFKRKNGERFFGEFVGTIMRQSEGLPIGFLGLIRDVSKRRMLELEQHRYFRVLEALSKGTPLNNMMKLIVEIAEEARPGMIGSILLLDEDKKCLRNGYAAGLPKSYCDAIDGIKIGPGTGSCGTAAHTGKRVIVEDVFNHSYWADFRSLAEESNLRACWSEPIFSPKNEILGTLAMYFPEPQTPSELDLELLEHWAQIAGIAIDRTRSDELLKTSEKRLGLAFQATNDAIWDLNVIDGSVWKNKAYYNQFGGPEDIGSTEWWVHLIHPNDRERVVKSAESFAAGAGDSDRWSIEYRIQRIDGFYAVVVDRAIRACDENGKPVRIIGSLIDITERRALEKEVIDISRAERRRIGNDLHDEIGQELTGLAMLTDALVKTLSPESGPEHDIALRIRRGAKRALQQVRRFASGMNPVDVDAQGLMSALTQMCHRVEESHDVSCAFECEHPVLFADNQTATHLYRIAQEATTNAIRHGRASRITIALIDEDDYSSLSILDNGAGFDQDARPASGMGLRIMGYRAGIIGAQLEIQHVVDGGTKVVCTIPKDVS